MVDCWFYFFFDFLMFFFPNRADSSVYSRDIKFFSTYWWNLHSNITKLSIQIKKNWGPFWFCLKSEKLCLCKNAQLIETYKMDTFVFNIRTGIDYATITRFKAWGEIYTFHGDLKLSVDFDFAINLKYLIGIGVEPCQRSACKNRGKIAIYTNHWHQCKNE